jgi:thymidylate synthase
MTKHYVTAHGLSEAWLKAASAVYSETSRTMTHLIVRIADPSQEDLQVRTKVDSLLDTLGLQAVESVRNTIFPLIWSQDIPDFAELAADYRLHYKALKALAGSNRGTYFGRIVGYQTAKGELDQLSVTIEKLKKSNTAPNPRWTSTYEINIYDPSTDSRIDRGFPCMSHLAFHLEGEFLHTCAQYRNQDLVERAYGNYLGLAQLQQYVAQKAGLRVGALTLFVGHAFVPTGTRRALSRLLSELEP